MFSGVHWVLDFSLHATHLPGANSYTLLAAFGARISWWLPNLDLWLVLLYWAPDLYIQLLLSEHYYCLCHWFFKLRCPRLNSFFSCLHWPTRSLLTPLVLVSLDLPSCLLLHLSHLTHPRVLIVPPTHFRKQPPLSISVTLPEVSHTSGFALIVHCRPFQQHFKLPTSSLFTYVLPCSDPESNQRYPNSHLIRGFSFFQILHIK